MTLTRKHQINSHYSNGIDNSSQQKIPVIDTIVADVLLGVWISSIVSSSSFLKTGNFLTTIGFCFVLIVPLTSYSLFRKGYLDNFKAPSLWKKSLAFYIFSIIGYVTCYYQMFNWDTQRIEAVHQITIISFGAGIPFIVILNNYLYKLGRYK